MLKYIVKRVLILIPVIICISVILFAISKFMPGDPVRAMLPMALKAEQYQTAYDVMYRRLGLDKSVFEQYFRWMYNLVVLHDLGYSSMMNREVALAVTEPLKNTIILNAFINIFYLAIALPIGIKCSLKRGSVFDNGWQVFSLVTYSVPSFFLALSLIFVFSVRLGLLPMGGMPNSFMLDFAGNLIAWARHLVLPVVTLTIISVAGAMRYVRNAMIDALSQDYIRTARSKGLAEKVVIYSHAFRNALIPISTVIVFTLFSLFGGAGITETVFQYNGIGKLMLSAVTMRDRSLIITMDLFFAVINIAAVLVADVIYGFVDPRIKLK